MALKYDIFLKVKTDYKKNLEHLRFFPIANVLTPGVTVTYRQLVKRNQIGR